MSENEEQQTEEQTETSNIINPDEYAINNEESGEINESEHETPEQTETGGQYSDHVITTAVNRITPALINKLVLDCPDCDKLTIDDMQKSGFGEALAWFIDSKVPSIPTNTPEAALVTASIALIGYTASKHPIVKNKLAAMETAEKPESTPEIIPFNA